MHQYPHVELGLLVSIRGYLLAYDIFKEIRLMGHTMLPAINALGAKCNLNKLMVVADEGLLYKKNIQLLEQDGYKYISGA